MILLVIAVIVMVPVVFLGWLFGGPPVAGIGLFGILIVIIAGAGSK